ncbi:MAG: cysteine--tRNA ligase [Candidatus Berkelbacteria bacterium]|nr:cysteine--tRNA ligase [Candidatus Berkelbacteria bacterium]
MKIYNTMTSAVEEFKPIEGKTVKMYTCGPTVYDTAHIGNLRKYIADDVLERTLQANDYTVDRVMNITDVDDKTIKRSEGKKVEFDELTRKYEKSFLDNLRELNIEIPRLTRATEYVEKMAIFIEELLKKGYAYKTADGSVYFSISKFRDYGKLSKLENREIMAGARVNSDEYDKENPSDFALWKAWDESDGEIYWNSSLGKGRPGWHIECSTMSMDTLGETIDIHTGGVDNIFPHHENEIAQSEARSGKKFVDFWVHSEHLMVDGKKMSKSLGNLYALDDLKKKGFAPLDFRYFVIGAHYRSKINFTWTGLEAARNTLRNIKSLIEQGANTGQVNDEFYQKFLEKMNNDLGTPEALAVLHEMIKSDISIEDKTATATKMDEILGLELGNTQTVEIPADIIEVANQRKVAREAKDFAKSDELRAKISEMGWIVEDLPGNEFKIVKQ